GETDLVVLCHGGFQSLKELDQPFPESEILTEVMSSVEQSGAKYAALYVSDPFKSIHYPGYRELERFLADDTAKNGSASPKVCDEVCQLKSSLLEGVLVCLLILSWIQNAFVVTSVVMWSYGFQYAFFLSVLVFSVHILLLILCLEGSLCGRTA
ncbi:hypothetical protein Goari_010934, partial [Gossypium aridum]|nr:hypothetical protein [Gossypium aridum]